MKLLPVLTAVAVCIPVTVAAQTERDLESHVHGAAALNVVLADSQVFIELATPWNNLVGFEHSPETEAQQALVHDALETLNSPEQLFAMTGGNCQPGNFQIESAMSLEDHGDEHDEEHSDEDHDEHGEEHGDEDHDEHREEHSDEDHDEHSEKHGDEDHDEHSEDHGDEHHDEHDADGDSPQTHTSILATYSYECSDIGTLSSIDLLLFSVWPGFADLDVQLVGESKQEFVELGPDNTILSVSEVQ